MSELVTSTRPDTRDMVAVHAVFRNALGAAPRIVGGASRNDREHAENVATYYADVLAFLQVHHDSEDALLWPKLLERCPAEAARVQQIADQHHGVAIMLEVAETHLAGWREQPDTEHGAKLAGALVLLGRELATHLDQEEAFVLPLAAEHLTAEEWAELPAHGMQHFRGDRTWVLLGLLFEAMPPGAAEVTLTHLPPAVAEFWTTEGRFRFEAFIADVRR